MLRPSTADSTHWLTMHDPLTVVPWPDAIVERFGHAPRSVYVETYWLPILGPSATWAMRRLIAWLDAEPDGYELPLAELGRALGLGSGSGRNAAVTRTLSRLITFGMATPLGDALAVRRMLAPLTRRQVRMLPDALAARHDAEPAAAYRPLSGTRLEPASTTLCDTTSLVRVAPAVEDARHGEAGTGTAARSGKPTAVPPASVRCADHGGAR